MLSIALPTITPIYDGVGKQSLPTLLSKVAKLCLATKVLDFV